MELLVALVAIIVGFGVSYFWYRPYVVTLRGFVCFFLALQEKNLSFYTENNKKLSSYEDFENYINEV